MPDEEEISLRDTIKQSIKEVTGEEYAPPPPPGNDIPDEIIDEFREREGIKDEEVTAQKPDTEVAKPDTNVPEADKPPVDPSEAVLATASPEVKALFEAQAPVAKLGKEISEVFAPFAEIVKASGMTEAKIVEGWIGLYNMARQDPTGYATHMLKSLQGYDKAAVAAALGIEAPKPAEAPKADADDDDDVFADPEVKALKKELAELKAARAAPAPQPQQQPQATPEQIAQRAVWEDRIQQFANEKDAAGNPVNVHFQALQREMATLATAWRQEGRTFTVRELYEGAIPMNPNISALVQNARKEAAEAADRQRKQAAIDKAKRAATSVRTDDEATVRPTKFDDLDQRSQIAAIAKGLKVIA